MSVKNTFVYAVSVENADSADCGMCRSSSCPSLIAACAPPRDDVNSEDAVAPVARFDSGLALSRLGNWADADSDCEEHDPPSDLCSIGLSGLSFIGEGNKAFHEHEKSPAALEPIVAQTPVSSRTRLSSRASAFSPLTDSSALHTAFVPLCPLNIKASAFTPRSSQVASMPTQAPESADAPVPDVPGQASICPEEATTVMLRNLPCGFTRKALLGVLNKVGFQGCYDFAYIPIDFENKLCKGYAFVNLNHKKHVQRLIVVFDGFDKWNHCKSSKVCKASLSNTQGLAANIRRYQNSPIMGPDVPDTFKPVLFAGRRQVPFPEPTRELGQVHRKMNFVDNRLISS